jgi:hypothetical protein
VKPQTQRIRRGHDFYPLADARVPDIYETENQPCADKLLYLHYFAGGCDWWFAEYDPDTGNGFGYACLGDPENAEWGYVDLPELESVNVHHGLVIVERDLHWTPRPAHTANLPGWRASHANTPSKAVRNTEGQEKQP